MKKKSDIKKQANVQKTLAPLKKGPQKIISKKRSYRVYLEFFVILILVFIAYGNSARNDYNIDDGYVVSLDSGNPLTKKGISGIPEILSSRYNVGEGVTYGYRPLG